MARFRKLLSAGLLLTTGACSDRDGSTPPTGSGGSPTITAIDPLVPGQPGRLRGTNLTGITTLTIGGKTGAITSTSDLEVHFSVPVMRECETDGRAVAVVANGAIQASARVTPPDLVRLQPGESRVVSAAELACLRFGAEAAAYVVSAHNFSQVATSEPFFRLRSYTVAGDTTATPLPSFTAAAQPLVDLGAEKHLPLVRPAHRGAATSGPITAFDPRYATAQVGDTLTFVDWSKPAALTARSRDQVPTYPAVVLAVAGQQVVVLDLRTPGAGVLLQNGAFLDRIRRAAVITDRYALPAVRAVIDPGAAFPSGGGGRLFTMVRELPPGITGAVSSIDLLGTSYSAWVSNIGLLLLNVSFADEQNIRPEQLATTMIHESAHLADVLAGLRRGMASAAGWVIEAIAVAVEERAARMAVGQEDQVTPTQAQADGVPAMAMRMPDGTSQLYSPWGPFGSGNSASSIGAYVRGARLVLYAMEQLGETRFVPAERSLYQRLLAGSPQRGSSAAQLEAAWGIDAIAREVGMSPEDLMEQATIAELTDDLVDAQAASARALPQFRTWSNALNSRAELQQRVFPAHWLPLDAAKAADVSVPGGAHHHWYLITDSGRGLSLGASRLSLQAHHRIRVTRLW